MSSRVRGQIFGHYQKVQLEAQLLGILNLLINSWVTHGDNNLCHS